MKLSHQFLFFLPQIGQANPNTNAEDKGLKVTSVNSNKNKALTSEEKAAYSNASNYEKNTVDVFLNENLITKAEVANSNEMTMPNRLKITNMPDNAIALYETDYTARDDVSSDIRY